MNLKKFWSYLVHTFLCLLTYEKKKALKLVKANSVLKSNNLLLRDVFPFVFL